MVSRKGMKNNAIHMDIVRQLPSYTTVAGFDVPGSPDA
jgi:hypothetical protein